MAKGTQYSKQFKEDAVRYRKDHPELPKIQIAKNCQGFRGSIKN